MSDREHLDELEKAILALIDEIVGPLPHLARGISPISPPAIDISLITEGQRDIQRGFRTLRLAVPGD